MEPMTLGSPVGTPVQTPGSPSTNSTYLPSFLLGDASTPARIGLMSPQDSSRYHNTTAASLSSPISHYGSPEYRINRQKALFGGSTSPTNNQIGGENHAGGPPTRGLFDTVESPRVVPQIDKSNIPTSPTMDSQRHYLNGTANNTLFLDSSIHRGSNDPQGLLQWVTVFGFEPTALNTVLSYISSRVRVSDKHSPPHPHCNWIHLKCATEQEAQRALACNGNIVSGSIMIGVIPCTDEGVILSPEKENRARLNGSMRPFVTPGRSLQTPDSGGSRTPIRLQSARPLAAGFNAQINPQAVRSPENVPQKSTGMISKAMEYVFGW